MSTGTIAKNTPTASPEQACRELGTLLGLDTPVSVNVLTAFWADETYAHHLMTCKKEPIFLSHLLNNPPTFSSPRKSSLSLLKKVSRAMIEWGKAGFSTVDDVTLAKRAEACRPCPHRITPPDQVLYKMAGVKEICELCGCNLQWKMRIPTERCPAPHPVQTNINRWGQPLELKPGKFNPDTQLINENVSIKNRFIKKTTS